MKLAQRNAQALQLAASGNSQTSAAAAAVLWPDKEGHWQAVLPQLAAYLPSLMVLRNFDPCRKTGLTIWLKCAVAGVLLEVDFRRTSARDLHAGVSRARNNHHPASWRHSPPTQAGRTSHVVKTFGASATAVGESSGARWQYTVCVRWPHLDELRVRMDARVIASKCESERQRG